MLICSHILLAGILILLKRFWSLSHDWLSYHLPASGHYLSHCFNQCNVSISSKCSIPNRASVNIYTQYSLFLRGKNNRYAPWFPSSFTQLKKCSCILCSFCQCVSFKKWLANLKIFWVFAEVNIDSWNVPSVSCLGLCNHFIHSYWFAIYY